MPQRPSHLMSLTPDTYRSTPMGHLARLNLLCLLQLPPHTHNVHQPHRPRGYPALCLAERQPSYSAAQEGQFIWSPEQKLAGGEEHVETCPHQALF